MNDKQRESLSALLDGELTDAEAVESLLRQNGSHQAFAAMCAQRDAMHGQISPFLPANFAEQVALAVAAEPTILSPAAARAEAPVIQPQGEVVQGWFGGHRAQMAIAASVAAIGFVGLVTFGGSDTGVNERFARAPVSNPVGLSASSFAEAPTLSVRQDAVRQVTSDVRSIDFNSLSPQLRAQLIQHMDTAHRDPQLGAKPSNISFQSGN